VERCAQLPDRIKALMEKGVEIRAPFSIDIGPEVDLDRIAGGSVVLYPGTRLHGAKTLVCGGAKLGGEAPVTVVDCRIGPGVELQGGFFTSSVFLEKANMASGAHVREGCILEEEANGAHTVGIKQTILFPFVTLGSLVNFCDCLMAGGTSRRNHSEVGSSYIHFNYTPNQDKATASLIGDVPRGVMLRQPPIFLGGQGGLVGPSRIGYGTVIAAGAVYRDECPEGGKLLGSGDDVPRESEFIPGFYGSVKRRIANNVFYIANLLALRQWYTHVRGPFFRREDMGRELYEGLQETLALAVGERLKRFRELADRMETSADIVRGRRGKSGRNELLSRQTEEFRGNWPRIEEILTDGREATVAREARDKFVAVLQEKLGGRRGYIEVMQGLDEETAHLGTGWLQAIVDDLTEAVFDLLPASRP
jgi:bifunctional UDP-N-acetylglucosamine pyrophosphorylase / glucosamine-1-phosphate N-acetyltransferase